MSFMTPSPEVRRMHVLSNTYTPSRNLFPEKPGPEISHETLTARSLKIQELEYKLKECQEHAVVLRQSQMGYCETISTLEKENAYLREQVEEWHSKFNTTVVDQQSAHVKLNNMNIEFDVVKGLLESTAGRLETVQEANRSSVGRLCVAEQDALLSKERARKAWSAEQGLLRRLEEVMADRDRLKDLYEQESMAHELLKTETLSRELRSQSDLKEQVHRLQKELTLQRSAAEELERDVVRLREERAGLHGRNAVLEQQHAELKAENAAARETSFKAVRELNDARGSVYALSTDLAQVTLDKENESFTRDWRIRGLQAELSEERATSTALESRTRKLQQECAPAPYSSVTAFSTYRR